MTPRELDTIAHTLWPKLQARGLTQNPRGNWRRNGTTFTARRDLLPLIHTVDPDLADYLRTWIQPNPDRIYRINWALRYAAQGITRTP